MRIHVRDPGRATRSRRDLPWILTLLAVGGALAVTVVLTGTRLLVPSEQVVIPSSNWVWTRDGVVVEPVGPSGGIQRGDVVVAMNGVPLETWAADAFRLPWVAPAVPRDAAPDLRDTVRFEVRRDGELLTADAPRLTLPPNRAGRRPDRPGRLRRQRAGPGPGVRRPAAAGNSVAAAARRGGGQPRRHRGLGARSPADRPRGPDAVPRGVLCGRRLQSHLLVVGCPHPHDLPGAERAGRP